jgi:TetR/AcrR family transcriptional repressor of mexJK operon
MATSLKSPSDMSAPDYQPRRGRPTSDQTVAIEEQLVSTARRLFLEQGYARTSMQAIASAARVSKGTLYARYPTKSHLFRAIVVDRLSTWPQYDPSLNKNADIETRLLARATHILKGMRVPEIRAFDQLILAEANNFPELGRYFDDLGYQVTLMETASELEAEVRGDNEPTRNSIAVATIFQQALFGWIRSQANTREVSDEECEEFAKQVVALCLNGRDAW